MAPTVRAAPFCVKVVLRSTRLPAISCPACGPVAVPFTPMLLMPRVLRVCSSPAWLMPSWFRSCQTLRSAKAVSALVIKPSALLSRSLRASKPLAAKVLLALRVSMPNSSRPESMTPLPLRSRTNSPSLAAAQPVPVLMPSALWSKRTDPLAAINSRPSPSRSNTSGSRRGIT